MNGCIGRDALCTGCGTCAGVCPDNIIEMRKNPRGTYAPTLNNESCMECGLCTKVCPSISVNLIELNRIIFGKSPQDTFLGNYINCYIGHSIDEMLRYEAASGGLSTTLLIFALDEGIIDGAAVTRMSRDNPLEPEVFIARTKAEVISASKSKYCPVPLNIAIRDILNENGEFAIVGLPCHIQGIRKVEKLNEKMKKRVVLRIGLFCSHTVNFLGTKFLLQRANIKEDDVVKLDYRGKGWPGGMTVTLRDNREIFLPLPLYWSFFAPFFFTPVRCTLCSDLTNELADISVGDAWLPELVKSNKGESIIMTRTEVGEQILQKAVQKGKIKVTRVDSNEVVRSQRGSLYFKKKGLMPRMFIMRLLGRQIPEIHSKLPRSRGPLPYLGAVLTYLNIFISSRKRLQRLLGYAPLPILRRYRRVVIGTSIWRDE